MFQRIVLQLCVFVTVSIFQVSCNQLISQENNKLPKIIHDVTENVNEVLSGTLLKEGFVRNLGLHPQLSKEKLLAIPVTLLYSPDCSILEVELCEGLIRNASHIIFETFGININLLIYLTFDMSTISEFNGLITNSKIDLSELRFHMIVNIHDKTNCEDIQRVEYGAWNMLINTERWITLNASTKIGFGYNEALIQCEGKAMTLAINRANFLVLNLKFGETVGVTESYGLFKKRMDSLHEENLKFIKHNLYLTVNKMPNPIYFPTPASVGKEGHRRLLLNYAQSWTNTASSVNNKSMIIQIPHFGKERHANKFSVMPDVQSNTCNSFDAEIQNLKWYVPTAMTAISKYFNAVVLTHEQWKTLNSEEVLKLYETLKKPNDADVNLEVMLDYSDTLVHRDTGFPTINSCCYNWSEVERGIVKEPIGLILKVVPKVLIFQVSNKGTLKMKAHVPQKFAQQMSHKFKFGCSFRRASFKWLNESKVVSVVEACKEIGGSIYILKSEVNLQSKYYQQNYHLHYEDNVRNQLEAVNTFRKHILLRHPEATVHLRLDVWATKQVYIEENYQVTAFCNPAILEANLYVEAILNWAQINNFPVILKTAFDYLNRPDFSGWLSFLRPVEHLSENSKDILATNPIFVLRNYPTGINNWTVDPCVEWTQERPNVEVKFFHNPHIGAILNITDLINYYDSTEVYEIMLQFVLHRFQYAEIIVETNWRDFIKAIKALAGKNLIESNREFFVGYNIPNIYNVALFSEFLDQMKTEIIPHIKGIHIDLQEKFIIDGQFVLAFADNFKELDINVGILLNSTNCVNILHAFIQKGSNFKIQNQLSKLDYIFCKYELELLTQDDHQYLGNLFDSHLYFKRVFQQFMPRLKVFFRIEVNVILNKDTETMDRYLRLLTHFYKFGVAYEIQYFLVNTFDTELNSEGSGWWGIQNDTDLTDPFSYIEKESSISGRLMWYPQPAVKTNTKIVTQDSQTFVAVASVSIVLLILFIAISIFWFVRYKNVRKYLSKGEVEEFLHGRKRPQNNNSVEGAELFSSPEYMKFKSDYDLPKNDLIIDIDSVLGAGNFGTVYKGIAKGKQAAIKRPNKDCPKGTFKNVLSEVKVLCYIGIHSNVVCFFGAYTKEISKGVLYIATELCTNGSLESYLRKKKNVIAREEERIYQSTQAEDFLYFHELHQFSKDIANGMAYIESKHVVHGDLSARNVLLDGNNSCKIGDFGLSRKLYEYQKYVKKSQEPLPWKWMAYESLTRMEFTSKSDVWSYGVTLFEIYSLGGTPYAGLNWTLEFADELRNGLKLSCPQFASEEIYAKMQECWYLDSEQRPPFTELAEFFKQFCRPVYTVLPE